MRVEFGELARQEIADAREYLKTQHSELERQFVEEMRNVVARIEKMPRLFPVEVGDVRKCLLQRFPYALRYILRNDRALIIAVSHQHRKPDYWVDRSE